MLKKIHKKKNNFSVSIILPTLNSEHYLNICLDKLVKQKKVNIEILVIDGGSSDNTLHIAKEYDCRIFFNSKVTAEAAKFIGLEKSTYDYICFVDSDNIINDENYLYKAINTLNEKNSFASEPLAFEYVKNDTVINQYCSLMGLNDPVEFYLKRFDKLNILYSDFSAIKYQTLSEDESQITAKFKFPEVLPTFGANGFLCDKNLFIKSDTDGYFFDNDEVLKIYEKKKYFIISKIKTNYVHYFCMNYKIFMKKQDRRIKDFLYFSQKKNREVNKNINRYFASMIIKTIIFFPIFIDSLLLRIKSKRKVGYLTHIKLHYLTIYIYSINVIKYFLRKKNIRYKNRESW